MALRVGVNLIFLRPGDVGGAEVYCRRCVEQWSRSPEVRPVVFTNRSAAETIRQWGGDEVITVLDGPYSHLRRLAAENFRLASAVDAASIDVLFSPANIPPLLAPRGVPQVVTVHDLHHLHHPEHFPWSIRWGRRLLMGLGLPRVDRVVTPSEFTRRDVLAHYDFPADCVTAVHEGVGFDEVPEPAAVRRERRKLGLTGQYLFYPANAYPHKGHVELVEAFGRLVVRGEVADDTQLLFCGRKLEGWAPAARRVEALGLEGRVSHLGYLERERVLALLRGATAMPFPSRFEGFGLPLLEAMACQTPVVASDCTAIPEVVGQAARLVPPSSPAAWADALAEVLADPKLRANMVERGRQNLERFSWERCAAQILEVLRTAAGGLAECE